MNEFDSAIISRKGEYVLVNNHFMKKYGVYVKDDWNELLCLYGVPAYFEKVLELMKISFSEDLVNLILNKRLVTKLDFEFLLSNWDSVYWEFITRKDEYYECLLDSIQNEKGIFIEEINS